jgi:hypothetical protein
MKLFRNILYFYIMFILFTITGCNVPIDDNDVIGRPGKTNLPTTSITPFSLLKMGKVLDQGTS